MSRRLRAATVRRRGFEPSRASRRHAHPARVAAVLHRIADQVLHARTAARRHRPSPAGARREGSAPASRPWPRFLAGRRPPTAARPRRRSPGAFERAALPAAMPASCRTRSTVSASRLDSPWMVSPYFLTRAGSATMPSARLLAAVPITETGRPQLVRHRRHELHLLPRQRLGAPGRHHDQADGGGQQEQDARAEHQVAQPYCRDRGLQRAGPVHRGHPPAPFERADSPAPARAADGGGGAPSRGPRRSCSTEMTMRSSGVPPGARAFRPSRPRANMNT